MLFLDGAFTFSGQRTSFQRARRPDNTELTLNGVSPWRY
jgi:hypothetical protein